MVVYSSDNQLEWREVEERQLPALQLFATRICQPPSRAVDAIAVGDLALVRLADKTQPSAKTSILL